MPSNHLILCRPLLLLPSVFPSIRGFLDESVLCIRWSKYRSFSFNISPSNEHPGLISFRMDWLDTLTKKKKDGDISMIQEDIHHKSLGKRKLKQHGDATTHLLEKLKSATSAPPSTSEAVKRQEHPHTLVSVRNVTTILEDNLAISYRPKHSLSSNCAPKHLSSLFESCVHTKLIHECSLKLY